MNESDVDREIARRFQAAYDDSGVDRSQIRERLRLSPEMRLALLEDGIRSAQALREAVKRPHDEPPGDPRHPR